MYKVITPAGPLFVDTAQEAQELKKLYGWFYVKVSEKEEDSPINDKF